MKKTLYSLMLNDEVVREVDVLAHRLGTNRSALSRELSKMQAEGIIEIKKSQVKLLKNEE